MLPANPHGSCGFTVEVGSMAPLVTVVEGLKVGVATQLLPGLGCFCYFPLDVSYKTHTNCLLTAFKKIYSTVPIKFEKQQTFFTFSWSGPPTLRHEKHGPTIMPKKTSVNINEYFLPQCSQWLVAVRKTSRFAWYLIIWSARFEDRWAVGCHCHGARLPPGTGGGFPRHHASQFGCVTLVAWLCGGVVWMLWLKRVIGKKVSTTWCFVTMSTVSANAFYLHLIRHPFSLRLTETDLDMNCRPGSAPLLVGGDSAGGGTAVSLILRLKQGAGWTPQGAKGEGTWDECTHILPPLYFLLAFNWCFNPKWCKMLIIKVVCLVEEFQFSQKDAYTVSFDDCTSVDECGTVARFSNYIHTIMFAS